MRTGVIAIGLLIGLGVALPSSADEGKAKYEKDCAGCHGPEGHGDTKKGKKLKAANYLEVPELSGPGAVEHVTKTVRENKKHRKVSQKVSDADLAAIAQYVQALVASQK